MRDAMQSVRLHKSTRLNVLLTEDRPRGDGHWSHHLPRLLEPFGVYTHVAHSGRQAIDFAERNPIHAAVVDLSTPIDTPGVPATDGSDGMWLIELLRRLPNKPPFVVVTSPMVDDAQVSRVLHQALRAGAFSVLNRPASLNEVLTVFRRLVDTFYAGSWPLPTGDMKDQNNDRFS